MAVVENWATPLENAIKAALSLLETSDYKTLEELQDLAARLDGTPSEASLKKLLARKVDALEWQYTSALSKAEQSDSIYEVEDAIRSLEAMNDYRDSTQSIAAAKQRLERLKQAEAEAKARAHKRKILLRIAGVAAVAALIAAFIISDAVSKSNTRKDIDRGIALVDAGDLTEAAEVLQSLVAANRKGAAFNTLYTLSERLLEQTMVSEGNAAAFELYDSISGSEKDAVKQDEFEAFVAARLKDGGVSAVDRWELLTISRSKDWSAVLEGLGEDSAENLLSACAAALTEELASDAHRDMEAWLNAQYGDMLQTRMDPDAALRFVYALNGAGYNAEALLPEGITLNIPMAQRVLHLTDRLLSQEELSDVPDMTAILPVSVVESDKAEVEGSSASNSWKSLCDVTSNNSTRLETRIKELRQQDSRYTVRLLPEYLFRIDEASRPATYGDCTALLAMQCTYLPSDTVYTKVTRTPKNGSYNPYLSLNLNESYTYHQAFAAIDLVCLYDVKDVARSERLYGNLNAARVSNDAWFAENKDRSDVYVYSQENMLGVFNLEALREAYSDAIDKLGLYKLILTINAAGNADAEVNDHDAA